MTTPTDPEAFVYVDALVDAFIGAWNTDAEPERLRLLASCCEDGAHFISEEGVLKGVQALSDAIEAMRVACPLAVITTSRRKRTTASCASAGRPTSTTASRTRFGATTSSRSATKAASAQLCRSRLERLNYRRFYSWVRNDQ
jgi:hypothetical protein